MRARVAGAPTAHDDARVRAPVLGMVLFISSEVMFFGGLFGAYYALRANAAEWPPPGTPEVDLVAPAILTAVLLSSSATQHLAVGALRRGERSRLVRWLGATIGLGSLFLLGEAFEWVRLFQEDFTVSTNIFGTLFFTMTGFHGLHLIAGLAILALAWGRAVRSSVPGRRAGAIEAATLYWHFVDIVWIFLATSLYVLGAAA